MLIEATTVTVPSPRSDIPARTLNLKNIQIAEARHGEVAMVTPVKAPELLVLFNGAWNDCDTYHKQLSYALTVAEQELGNRRSTILLYEVETFLKGKNIPSTKDTRDAVIMLDTTVQELQGNVDQLKAVAEYMKGKMKFFEHAYSSVKKIMGEDAYNMSSRPNPNLSGGGSPKPFQQQTPTTTPTQTTKSSGYGKARYDR
jgi:hypothetical protein